MFNLNKKQNMNKQGFINVFFFLDERNNRLFLSSKKKKKKTLMQGPRSNFEIGGGGGTISAFILGGHKTLFLTNSL